MKPMSRRESAAFVKDIIKHKQPILRKRDLVPGKLLFMSYDAKDKTQIFDRRPMFLVLATSKSYTLGLNFHWLPPTMRFWLIKYIIEKNKKRRNPNLMEFTYGELKPLLRKLNYAPCIRLYIKKRLSRNGCVIPPNHFPEAARLDTAVFTGISAEKLYKMLVKKRKK